MRPAGAGRTGEGTSGGWRSELQNCGCRSTRQLTLHAATLSPIAACCAVVLSRVGSRGEPVMAQSKEHHGHTRSSCTHEHPRAGVTPHLQPQGLARSSFARLAFFFATVRRPPVPTRGLPRRRGGEPRMPPSGLAVAASTRSPWLCTGLPCACVRCSPRLLVLGRDCGEPSRGTGVGGDILDLPPSPALVGRPLSATRCASGQPAARCPLVP